MNIYRRYLAKKALKERPVDPMSQLSEEQKTLLLRQILGGVQKDYGEDVLY